ncbi:fumarylacetoacetate hydrolase family protein [Rhodococcus sp. IEGM 1354]|uniref:fumarylacetoacetate hydrolase family protein n=1 Tax=Rhodococcus sp. IEGM 1354 TaxID=3047088 RepID=UPI0024B7FBFC|nr:fumarylacetoacetate hydrolase family protein [Rhodococcus sp. IEGM 1354]MDI9932283.1 fumarylacetoacetate hydrolase family protein [Rhodococcus sp. IEGM 1354]
MTSTDSADRLAVQVPGTTTWVDLEAAVSTLGAPEILRTLTGSMLRFLDAGEPAREAATAVARRAADEGVATMDRPAPTLPVVPASLRCFLGWDEHWDLAAHNLVRRNLPRAVPFIRGFEMLTRRTFPALRPGPGFDDHPIYYTGNHLTVVADGADVEWPSYSRVLDFELEFGAVVTRPIRDATEREAETAIGGYVVFDDISARDTQWEEQRRTPFGPVVKTKTFASSMGADIVTPDEIATHLDSLAATVRVNGELWSTTSTAGMRYSLGESLAYASRGESIHPGELLTSGTLPRGCGLELDRWIVPGDRVELDIERIGSVANTIGVR